MQLSWKLLTLYHFVQLSDFPCKYGELIEDSLLEFCSAITNTYMELGCVTKKITNIIFNLYHFDTQL